MDSPVWGEAIKVAVSVEQFGPTYCCSNFLFYSKLSRGWVVTDLGSSLGSEMEEFLQKHAPAYSAALRVC